MMNVFYENSNFGVEVTREERTDRESTATTTNKKDESKTAHFCKSGI